MKVYKYKMENNNINLSNSNSLKKGDNNNKNNDNKTDDSQNDNFNTLTNTLYSGKKRKNSILLNILFNIKNKKSNKKKLSIFHGGNKNKTMFKNEIININMERTFNNDGINKVNINNNFSLMLKKALIDKFQILPNIKKYHNLTNEKLLKLIEIDNDNSFNKHKQRIKNNNYNYNLFNEYINNIPKRSKNKSSMNSRLMLRYYKKSHNTINNIRQNTLNSNYMDINYKANIHNSWYKLLKNNKENNKACNTFNSHKKTKNNFHQFSLKKIMTMTSDNSINNKTITNEKKKPRKSFLKNTISNESKIHHTQVKRVRKSSAIDRFLFKMLNKDECYEDYVSDGRPCDKYQFFKNQIEKKRKHIEKQLLELRRYQT